MRCRVLHESVRRLLGGYSTSLLRRRMGSYDILIGSNDGSSLAVKENERNGRRFSAKFHSSSTVLTNDDEFGIILATPLGRSYATGSHLLGRLMGNQGNF
ncbi:hypothetical protein IEQ34_001217 [Dendrobium chrysotoxum]|uniref:Uncharacterized protein n=1 Tax=Dendrobium chrysotoxum TaxID=161865 RepID=A0AAV7HN24_DENCH|nr:hypothetical protein IEQ34_001217 [Dendrobium chrysotoxum]